jgi:hypothetical protein
MFGEDFMIGKEDDKTRLPVTYRPRGKQSLKEQGQKPVKLLRKESLGSVKLQGRIGMLKICNYNRKPLVSKPVNHDYISTGRELKAIENELGIPLLLSTADGGGLTRGPPAL